ncbi:nascent polypeptide-associated complex subunit alpha, muscle-specific form-like [Schistocerca gregaria]|uniref:nascent polypeptide-associated complex subunit alpha, muscle-specific form-like n=1 Tax=Schistocerca gregaria TaxID=7010 RepID=UPI00211DF5C0|nr:nascent polypeptide-associated complex subunit alpha, muscle-specific form-like [Schistocerca gregaria]
MSNQSNACTGAEGVADRRQAELASSAAPSGPPLKTTRRIHPAHELDDSPVLPAAEGSAASPGGELPPSQPTLDVTTGRCGIDSGIDEAALRELDRANGASVPPSRGTSPRAPRQRQCSTSVPRPSPAPLDMPDISDAVCVSESDSDSVTGYIDDSDIAEGLEESLIALRDAAEEEGLPCDPALRARILFPNAAAADADGDAMQCEMESRKRKPAAASSDSEAAPSEAARGKKQKAAADAEGFAVPRKTAPRRRIVKTPVLPGVADRRPSGPARATELIPVAAPSGPPLMTNRLTTTDHDRNDSSDSDVLSRDRVFILMNKLAHGGSYPGRKDDEATILAFCHIRKGATLPYTRQQVSGVPPRAPPVESRESAVPAVAASAGVAPLASTTEEVDVPPAAPLVPKTREEPVATLAAAAEMQDIDLPDANLAEAIAESERRDTDSDAARAPRKRRAMTHDDSDTPSQTSDTARPRKKASRASRPSTTESGTTIAGSSASAASPRPTKTRRPTRPPATSRQPDEDGFVAPPRRRTARAAALQQPTPLPTANAFAGASVDATEDGAAPPVSAQKKPSPIVIQWAGGYKEFQQKLDRAATSATVKTAGRDLYKVTVSSNEEYRAVMDTISRDGLPGRNHRSGGAAPSRKVHPSTSFAAATKGGPSTATARRSELAAGETRQPAAPSPASPGGEANPTPTQSARVAAPRRRRRRAGRATHAAARRTADDTLPQQTTAPRATPPPAADAPRQSSTTELPQPASPVAEAAPAANAAPSATDAAELRTAAPLLNLPLHLAYEASVLQRASERASGAGRNPLIQNVLPHLDPEDERKLMQAVVRTEKRREMRRMEQKREQIKQETKFIREIGRKADRKILPKTTAKLLVREKRKRAKSPKRKPGTSEPLPLLFETHPTTDTADEAAETATPGPSNASAGETIVTDGSPAEASTPAVTTNENPKPSTSSLVQDATHDTQDAPPTNSPQSPEPAHANVTAAAEHAPATAEEPEANGTFELARRTAKVKPPPAAAGTACATSNKYDALDEDAQTPPAPPPPKTQQNTQHPKHERLPPIVATYPDTYKKMYDLITAAIGDERFHAKSAGGDKIKITLKTIDDYNTTKNTLKQHHIPHYTYPTGAQKTLKVVLRGFPTRTDPADIKDAITAKGYDVRSVRKQGSNNRDPLYCATLIDTQQHRKLFQETRLMGLGITTEPLKQRARAPQCFNCQVIGHVNYYCDMPPRCVRCAGGHASRECKMSPQDKPKCANCSGAHTASYRGCPAHKRAKA